MSNRNDGGPAFPQQPHLSQHQPTGEVTTFEYVSGGMTLRDYFAGQALAGLITSPHLTTNAKSLTPKELHQNLAECSYFIADAMTDLDAALTLDIEAVERKKRADGSSTPPWSSTTASPY